MSAPPRVAVATSGGRDSTALLHCTLRQAREVGVEVWALHVHHGLMPEADAWLAQVRAQARRWGAHFDTRRLHDKPAAGDSVEAWARVQRYHALTEMAHAHGCTLVLLAHHRQDQAETWLLQALRGAGHLGLSAMPGSTQRHGITWARPWLEMPREAIEAYVRRHRVQHVDDSSNADPRYARSRLRTQVWPALLRAFPHAETSLAAAATHAQEASMLAAEVADIDLAACADADGLQVGPWLGLSPARRGNALRAWLRSRLDAAAPPSLIARLLAEVPGARLARWPAPGAMLTLHRGRLTLQHEAAAAMPSFPRRLSLSQPGVLAMPDWHGCLHVRRVREGGIATEHLQAVLVHARRGGERLRFAPKAAARSLKKQFQSRDIPAWARDAPIVSHADGRVIFVPGLGVDAAFQAAPGVEQLSLDWRPD